MADCLSNSVVVRKIFEYLSTPELLKLSLVNKSWNHEARSEMRKRGSLTAHLKFQDNQHCQDYLEAFAADLLRMNVVPFSGIWIQLGHCSSACQIPALDSTYSTILNQQLLKRVSVQLTGERSKNKDCPGSVLVTKVLEHFSGILEQVSLAKMRSEQELIAGYILDGSFQRLRILKLGDNFRNVDGSFVIGMRALLARAPKLQELHTEGPINLMLNVLEGRSTVLVYQSGVSAPFDEIPDDAINAIRLQRMQMQYEGPDFNVERFNRITPMLLQACCTATLGSMYLDAYLAVPLMCYGIRLKNVTQLTMNINHGQLERLEPRILGIVKNFDYTRIFPNLDTVAIYLSVHSEVSLEHIDGFVEEANASLKEPELDRAINIKELRVSTSITSANADFYAEMFPHIRRLEVREEDGSISFGSIWKHWVDLRGLVVWADLQKYYKDLDSYFCGIFPEEVTELREKDEEFLKKVNIVPVMPAITSMRNLRFFMLNLDPSHPRASNVGHLDNVRPRTTPLTLSKVTGLLAFARLPKLVVAFTTHLTHIHQALLREMQPYAYIQKYQATT